MVQRSVDKIETVDLHQLHHSKQTIDRITSRAYRSRSSFLTEFIGDIMWARLKNIVLLCVATVSFCASKSNLLDFYDFRCNAASIPSLNTGSYCDIISWTAARVYPVSLGVESGRFYDAGNPFGIAEQDNIARRYGAAIIPNVTTPECRNALKWLSCTTVFPRCLVIGAVSHLEPCQYQCKQVQDACTDLQIDCSSFSSTSCTFYVAEGFNTLPLHKVNCFNV